MKKLLTAILTVVMLIGISAALNVSAADVAPKFTEKFFPSGKANAPTDIYYEVNRYDDGRAKQVYLWFTQPDDVTDMFYEYNYMDSEQFEAAYDCTRMDCHFIQIDCRVDDGEWHYMPEWDRNEYPQEDQPYDLAIRQHIWADTEQKTYREGCALIDPWYGGDDESAGYLKPVIKTGDEPYLDLENHSLTLRLRYLFCIANDNMTDAELSANNGENCSYTLSDWSEEITIGKNATQKELEYPEKIEAPAISELTFVESVERDDGNNDTTWKVFVDFPKSNGDAVKYYSVEMNSWDSLCAVMQYRVKEGGEWGEWKNTDWGNPTWLFSGWKQFVTEEVSKDDAIEFRVYLENWAEEGKNSPYSESLFCNAGDARTEGKDPSEKAEEGGKLEADEGSSEESKCRVCGICPVQPLGICLFIWIAIILIIIIVIAVLVSKSKKNRREDK